MIRSTQVTRRIVTTFRRNVATRIGTSLHGGVGQQSDVEMIATHARWQSQTLSHCRNFTTNTTTTNSNNSNTNNMQDEYGAMDDAGHTYTTHNFRLESGQILEQAQLRYQTYGDPNNPCLVICHALTGNASLHTWWSDMLGSGRPLNTDHYFVVCCNLLGSCYGSTNPTSINPVTQQPYGMDFPKVTVQDNVRLQRQWLYDALNLDTIRCVIGGSFGGMQVLEYAVQASMDDEKDDDNTADLLQVEACLPIACGLQHTAWQIGLSSIQRQAIYRDAYWKTTNNNQKMKATTGLELARQLAMITYRTPQGYAHKFGRNVQDNDNDDDKLFAVESYLDYQGRKFLDRFDPVTYVKLTEQMDTHDVYRHRPHDILESVTMPVLVLGIDSDILYPLSEQQAIVDALPNAQLKVIESSEGHDGFLLEQDQVGQYIRQFLDELKDKK